MSQRDDTDTFSTEPPSAPAEIGDRETAPARESGTDHTERWESTQDIESDELADGLEKGPATPNLVIISGARAGEARHLDYGRTLLGRRRSQVDIWFRDTAVSRLHAAVEPRADGKYLLRDLGSSNGTFLNGQRVRDPTELTEGDKISLGNSVVLKFTCQDELDEKFQRQMYESSIRDELTGAFSRSYLLEQMRSEMAYAERHDTPLALLFVDLDHFKRVNDTHGHVVGDEILAELTRRLRQESRREDLLARYGGEEFALLVRNASHSQLERFAERARRAVANEKFETDETSLSVTISIGIAEYDPDQMDDTDDWVRAADRAMYCAKEAGRNCVQSHRSPDQ